MEVKKEGISPEMQKLVEEVEAEEAVKNGESEDDNQKKKPEEEAKKETPKEDPGKIDNQDKPEDVPERKSRYVPVAKLQEKKREFREALRERDEKIANNEKQIKELSDKIAELSKAGKEERDEELESLAEEYNIPVEFLKKQEELFRKRSTPEKKEEKQEEKPKSGEEEEKKTNLSPTDQALLDKAKEDEGFKKDFKSSLDSLPEEDQELFRKNRKDIKKLAFTEEHVKKSLTDIFYTLIKPEVTGSKTSEDGGLNIGGSQKRAQDITDTDIDKMSDEDFEKYKETLKKI